MPDFVDKVNKLNISRRNFIKASTAAAASLSLVGCGNTLTTTGEPLSLCFLSKRV